jgi:hypothetical protein
MDSKREFVPAFCGHEVGCAHASQVLDIKTFDFERRYWKTFRIWN